MGILLVLALLLGSSSMLTPTGSPSFVRSFFVDSVQGLELKVVELPDGNTIVAHRGLYTPTNWDMFVYRLDSRGVIQWAKRLATNEPNDAL